VNQTVVSAHSHTLLRNIRKHGSRLVSLRLCRLEVRVLSKMHSSTTSSHTRQRGSVVAADGKLCTGGAASMSGSRLRATRSSVVVAGATGMTNVMDPTITTQPPISAIAPSSPEDAFAIAKQFNIGFTNSQYKEFSHWLEVGRLTVGAVLTATQ
jgi:hypothetical protein